MRLVGRLVLAPGFRASAALIFDKSGFAAGGRNLPNQHREIMSFGLFSGDAAVYALLRFGTGCLCFIPLMIQLLFKDDPAGCADVILSTGSGRIFRMVTKGRLTYRPAVLAFLRFRAGSRAPYMTGCFLDFAASGTLLVFGTGGRRTIPVMTGSLL